MKFFKIIVVCTILSLFSQLEASAQASSKANSKVTTKEEASTSLSKKRRIIYRSRSGGSPMSNYRRA